MATTYGYGGEFSSDEDVDKLERQQQGERMVQAKFDNNNRPGKRQIEDLINSIKTAPYDQEFQVSDDFLAGLLDYYKTPRGPIVDSTRKLYHKIALRLVRGDQPQATDDNVINGNSHNMNSDSGANNNNNNSINIIHKVPQQSVEAFSSDDEENPVAVSKKIFDSRVVYTDNDDSKMEVDSETPTGPLRETKQIDLSSTDEDSESEDSEVTNSESDVLDETPIKPTGAQSREKEGVEALMAARPATPKLSEHSIKRQPLAQSTPKETIGTSRKPYTRSQRVATRSATRNSSKTSVVSLKDGSLDETKTDTFIGNKTSSRRKYTLLTLTLLIAVVAFLLYHYRSILTQSAKPIISF